jgi:CHAT domain-containing protein/Flp pilus assembly protein TadD
MIRQKLSILIFILIAVSALFIPNIVQSSAGNNPESEVPSDIDSIKTSIKSGQFNYPTVFVYKNYLLNNKIDNSIEREFIASLPDNSFKVYLSSLIFKKEKNYGEMFSLMFGSLKNLPEFTDYYDELIFSAKATTQLVLIDNFLESSENKSSFYFNYLEGHLRSATGEYKNALRAYLRSYELDPDNTELLYQISYTHRYLGDYSEALNFLIKAKNISQNNLWYMTKIYSAEGSLYFLSGEYDKAEVLYKQSSDLSFKIGDRINFARSLINLAILDDISGRVDDARIKFQNAIETASEINDVETAAIAYAELGVSFSFTNEIINAKENYLKSLELQKKLGNKLRISYLHENLGNIYAAMFNYEQAIKQYENGLKAAGENKRAQILNTRGLADVYSNLSNYSKAIQLYRDAQKISAEINDISSEADINSGLGILNFNLGLFQNSLAHFKTAEELHIQTENLYSAADINHKIGAAYIQLDNLDSAKKYLEKSLEYSQQAGDPYTEALSYIELSYLFLQKNELQNALARIKRSLEISSQYSFHHLTAQAYLAAGEIQNKNGNFSSARESFMNANSIGSELNEFNLIIESNYKLARLFEKEGFDEAAESYYKSAVSSIENVSIPLFAEEDVHISYLSEKNEVYSSFAEFYLDRSKFEQAFELLDKSRSRNLMQNLNNLKLKKYIEDELILNQLYEYEWMINSKIYPDKINDSLNILYSDLKRKVIQSNPASAKYLNFAPSIKIEDVQNNLKEHQCFLYIYSTNENTYLFVINKNEFSPFKIPGGKNEVIKLMGKISPYFLKENPGEGTYYNQDLFAFDAKAAYEFYQKFISHASEKYTTASDIIISPSIETAALPFEFLITEFNQNESAYNYSDKKYLLLDHNISYTPSGGIFIQQQNNKLENSGRVLVVGDPSISGSNTGDYADRRGLLEDRGGLPRNVALLPLQYSGEEINEIGSLINADRVLSNNDATETNFKNYAELSRIIHLSTHSFLFNNQPLIFFSNFYDPENDGYLEASEIVQMKLNSDLVVLSSCNSGLGRIDNAEGIIGMTKAFFEAGAKSVVVSLWEVNDKYTAKLMALFYKKLSEGNTKSQALRSAKIEFIQQESANPFFWSAFIISGNISPVEIRQSQNTYPYIIAILLIVGAASLILFFRGKRRN